MIYVKTYLPTLKTHVVNLKRDVTSSGQRFPVNSDLKLSTITFNSEGVWKKCCVVFRLLLMAIFAFGVSGEYPCQSEFIPPFMRTRRLNALEVQGIETASMKIQCWTNKKNNFYFSFLAFQIAIPIQIPTFSSYFRALWWARNNFGVIFSFVYAVSALFTFHVLVAYGGPRSYI